MAKRDEILQFIHEILTPENFNDYCVNGLQVEGKAEIQKIVLGVSVSERLFQAALAVQADMILVHHGLFWRSDPHPFHLTGLLYRRLKLLIQSEINLAGYHLPLDAHPEIGNNAQIIKQLGMQPIKAVDVGFLGELPEAMLFTDFHQWVDAKLATRSFVLPWGPARVQKALVISGGSSPEFELAAIHGADVFIGGDIRENVVRSVEETGINFINAGHYNTEKFGIQALGAVIQEKFGIPCEFIDIPNPV